MKKIIATLLLSVSFGLFLFAQVNLPPASTKQIITNEFGSGKITIEYARPNLKNRTYFAENSELAPIGKLWRFGANAATTIKFTEDVTINEKPLAAGTYSVYAIPGKETMSVIFNKGLKNWGLDGYKESEDVLRVSSPVEKSPFSDETFALVLTDVKKTSCKLLITWGHYDVYLNLTTNPKNKMVQPSSKQIVINNFGLGDIEFSYCRPNINNRTYFAENSELAPQGKLWRLGANAATLIKFTNDVKIDGKELKAGKYALYAIPSDNSMEFVFNKGVDNWGTEGYKENQDVLRVKLPLEKSSFFLETFDIEMVDVKDESCKLLVSWGNKICFIPITTNVKDILKAKFEKELYNTNDKTNFYDAARFYFEYEKDFPLALECINKAISKNPKGYWLFLLKARILKESNNKEEAKTAAETCAKIAAEEKNDDYVTFANELIKNL